METTHTEHRYNRLTWAEMNEAIARQPVVILPTASTEQHGHHLPIDVDLLLCESVCLEAGRRADGGILVLPAIPYGLNLHHIDCPATVAGGWYGSPRGQRIATAASRLTTSAIPSGMATRRW